MYSYPKVNLGLGVMPKLANEKLHKLKTIMIEVRKNIYDILDIKINNLNVDRFYNISKIGFPNTISQAINLLRKHYKIKCYFDVKLTKQIPIGGGLGGGSSNAVTTTKIITTLLGIPWEKEVLKEMLFKIGSDVPFFVEGGSCYVGMYGEFVEPIKLSFPNIKFIYRHRDAGIDCLNILLRPKKNHNTKKIYDVFDLLPPPQTNFGDFFHDFKEKTPFFMKKAFNDLEMPVNKLYSPLKYKNQKFKYLLTGSGSSYLMFNPSKIKVIF